MLKTCKKCGETQPLDNFYNDKTKKDGKRPQCKTCTKEYSRRYREENRDKISERHRRYREENRDKVLERKRRYREENRDKIREQKRRYREENRDKERERHRRYREECKALGVTPKSVTNYKKKVEFCRLMADRNGKPWQEWEDAYILNHGELTLFQIALDLGRSYNSVRDRWTLLKQTINN